MDKTKVLPPDFFQEDGRAISAKDLLLLAGLPAMAAVAWTCSDSLCLQLTRAVTRFLQRIRPQRYRDYQEIFRDFLPQGPDSRAVDALCREAAALQHLERLQLLRYYRPGGWRPRISVEGLHHLERALSEGKGAILWVTYATFSDMISKVALHQHGYRVWHLSRHIHGHFSVTRFGIKVLNPIRIAVERRHLADRVVIDPGRPKAALQRLEQLLGENQVVSITVGPMARRVTLVPFGPGHLPLAGGAPNLALNSGAALLPLFIERREDGSFLVTIESPLEAPALVRQEQIAQLALGEGRLLRNYFIRVPTQYLYADMHHVRRRCRFLGAEERKSP